MPQNGSCAVNKKVEGFGLGVELTGPGCAHVRRDVRDGVLGFKASAAEDATVSRIVYNLQCLRSKTLIQLQSTKF